MGRAVGEPLCQQCKIIGIATKWRPGRARRHGGALRRAELVAGDRRPAIIRRLRPDQPHPSVARLGRQAPRCGGRVGQRRHVDGHRVGGRAVPLAVVHLEGETRIRISVRVRRRRVFEVSVGELHHRHLVVHAYRRARERESAVCGQRRDRDARERVAFGIRVIEIGLRERVFGVLVHRHRAVRRRRRGVDDELYGGCDAVRQKRIGNSCDITIVSR